MGISTIIKASCKHKCYLQGLTLEHLMPTQYSTLVDWGHLINLEKVKFFLSSKPASLWSVYTHCLAHLCFPAHGGISITYVNHPLPWNLRHHHGLILCKWARINLSFMLVHVLYLVGFQWQQSHLIQFWRTLSEFEICLYSLLIINWDQLLFK